LLFTILHNQHVNDVRRSVREGITVELGEAPQLTVESNAVPSLELRDLERAIGKLPAEQRAVILLVGSKAWLMKRLPWFSISPSAQCARAYLAVVTSCAGSWVWNRNSTTASDPARLRARGILAVGAVNGERRPPRPNPGWVRISCRRFGCADEPRKASQRNARRAVSAGSKATPLCRASMPI